MFILQGARITHSAVRTFAPLGENHAQVVKSARLLDAFEKGERCGRVEEGTLDTTIQIERIVQCILGIDVEQRVGPVRFQIQVLNQRRRLFRYSNRHHDKSQTGMLLLQFRPELAPLQDRFLAQGSAQRTQEYDNCCG